MITLWKSSGTSGSESRHFLKDFLPLRDKLLSTVYLISLGNKCLSYRRETALQGELVVAKSGTLELGNNI